MTTPPGGSVLFNNLLEFPSLLFGSFGVGWGIGWLDTQMHALTRVNALAAYMMLIVLGLRYMDRGKLAGTLGLFGATVFLPLYVLQTRLDHVGTFLQPRYMYPMVVVVLAAALVDRTGITRLSPAQASVVYGLCVTAHAAALHANIRRYVTGQEIFGLDLSAGAEWWWDFGPGPTALWMIGSLAFAVFALPIFGDFLPGARASASRIPSGVTPQAVVEATPEAADEPEPGHYRGDISPVGSSSDE